MTVEALIERLQKFDPDAIVRLHGKEGEPVLFVEAIVDDDKNVWLESEQDADIASEIQARFDNAIEEGLDEDYVYADMLEIGLDVPMVRKYMGDEAADHMADFCKEHGML